jgi:uncharacterized membrane protein (DUF2068 family)
VARPPETSLFGFKVIGALKVMSGLLFLVVGTGIFRLVNRDVDDTLEHIATIIKLDPENHFIHSAISRAAGIKPSQLRAIGVGTFFYAILHLIEGTGLLMQRDWAGYLTVIATASLIPVEVYEIAKKVSAVRIAVLIFNILILIYIIVKLRQERRALAAHRDDSGALAR